VVPPCDDQIYLADVYAIVHHARTTAYRPHEQDREGHEGSAGRIRILSAERMSELERISADGEVV
jgi:hypothetical protein